MSDGDRTLALEGAMLVLARREISTSVGRFEATFFRDQAHDRTAMALARGDLGTREPLLVRVHSSCLTSECLMAGDCDCASQLARSLETIATTGRGVVFYLMQEGRGAGLTAKARDRMIVQASGHRLTTFDAYAEMGLPLDLRDYECLGPMARALGIEGPLTLLTNNPEKARAVGTGLAREKIEIVGTRAIEGAGSPFNLHYLSAKKDQGHALTDSRRRDIERPPNPMRVEEAHPARDAPHLVSTAQYFLPILLSSTPPTPEAGVAMHTPDPRDAVEWFRMRVVYDRRTARESVLLSLEKAPSAFDEERSAFDEEPSAVDAELSALDEEPFAVGPDGHARAPSDFAVTMTLVDRLPLAKARGRDAVLRALHAMREAGGGRVVVHFNDDDPHADLVIDETRDANAPLSREILGATWQPGPAAGGTEDGGC